MKELLKGRKTYLVSALIVLDAVLKVVNGASVSSVLPLLFAGSLGASLRAAIAKVETKVLDVLPKPVEEVVKPVVDEAVAKVEGQ